MSPYRVLKAPGFADQSSPLLVEHARQWSTYVAWRTTINKMLVVLGLVLPTKTYMLLLQTSYRTINRESKQ